MRRTSRLARPPGRHGARVADDGHLAIDDLDTDLHHIARVELRNRQGLGREVVDHFQRVEPEPILDREVDQRVLVNAVVIGHFADHLRERLARRGGQGGAGAAGDGERSPRGPETGKEFAAAV